MTTPNGAILFNSGTGSDSLASGIGPATAVNSTTESTTASYSTTTITFSGATDLSSVAAGDMLYLVTSTGRKFFIIASVNDGADTLTIDDTPTGTASGLNWAIGGKRLSLNGSLELVDQGGSDGDMKDGWIIEFEDGYTETLSATVNLRGAGSNAGKKIMRGAAAASTMPILTFSNNGSAFIPRDSYWSFQNFEMQNTNATKTGSDAFLTVGDYLSWYNVVVADATNNFDTAITVSSNGSPFSVERCHFANLAAIGIEYSASRLSVLDSSIHDCGSHGILLSGDSFGNIIHSSAIYGNGGDGIRITSGDTSQIRSFVILNNAIYNNTSDGIEITIAAGAVANAVIRRNIITGNTGYGLNFSSATSTINSALTSLADFNGYYNNTSGHRNNISAGSNDTDMTADPFVNAASADFNINNTANGGADLRAVTFDIPS